VLVSCLLRLDVAQKEHKNIAEEKQKIERILKEEMNTAKVWYFAVKNLLF